MGCVFKIKCSNVAVMQVVMFTKSIKSQTSLAVVFKLTLPKSSFCPLLKSAFRDDLVFMLLLSLRKGKFLHHYENYGATAKDIADWLKK